MSPERRRSPDRGAPTFAGLIAALAAAPILPGAACKDEEASLFDADHDDVPETAAERKDRHALAVSICHACPAIDACRDWAASMPRGSLRGVVAGEIRHRHITITPTEGEPR